MICGSRYTVSIAGWYSGPPNFEFRMVIEGHISGQTLYQSRKSERVGVVVSQFLMTAAVCELMKTGHHNLRNSIYLL